MNAAGHCIRCKGSMICDKYGVTIQSLRIQSGWYRFSEDSHDHLVRRVNRSVHCIQPNMVPTLIRSLP